jgi:hypothetical protein
VPEFVKRHRRHIGHLVSVTSGMGVMGVWTVLCVVLPGTLTLAQVGGHSFPPASLTE